MFLVGLISWWYSNGFIRRINIAKTNLKKTFDVFSIGILLRTLFRPYKQISADESSASINMLFQVLFDKLISRVVGFVARSCMIVVGTIVILLQLLLNTLMLTIWLIIPVLPFIGVFLTISGWIPKWIM